MTELQFTQFMAYSAAVFNNCGNFRSFGDTKFVPEFENAVFVKIFESSSAYETHREVLENIWARIEREVYTEEDPH